jgi:predicted RND superfamily exporter protein
MVQLFNKITQRDVQVLLKIIPAKISSSFIYYQVQEEFDDNQQAYLLIKVRDKLINAPEYFINGWEEFSKYLYETFGISLDELITLQKKDDLKTKFLKRKASVKPTITNISLNNIQQK